MANREIKRVKINRDCFMKALELRNCSIRKLDDPTGEKGIGRTEKTIRRALKEGKMTTDLLDNIARYLNVHPDYLAGVYDEQADSIEDDYLREIIKRNITPDKYPYLLKAVSDVDYYSYFENMLNLNGINIVDFKRLPSRERVLFHQEIQLAIFRVIAKHFDETSLGESTFTILSDLERTVKDFDPLSAFAEMEGVGISEEEIQKNFVDCLEESDYLEKNT